MSNFIKSAKNLRSFLFVFLSLFTFFAAIPLVKADPLRRVVDSPSNDVAGSISNHTISFTTSSRSVPIKSIVIVFPSGFDISNANLGAYTPSDGEANPVLSIAGQAAIITFGTPSAGNGSSYYALTIENVRNTNYSGNTSITVTTYDEYNQIIDGPTQSTPFPIRPASISDLTCETASEAGGIWLRWTVPLGTSNGYQVMYEQGNVVNGGYQYFEQNWSSGAVGSAQQQIVTGLNPNTQYTFRMVAKGNDGTISDFSTLTPTCYAGGGTTSKSFVDNQAPITRIVFPTMKSTVSAKEPLIIRGTSMDKGGSSVKLVEISLDNGITWNAADIVATDGENRIWRYIWSRPLVGSQKLLVRSSDWMNNLESPVSIDFVVSDDLSSESKSESLNLPLNDRDSQLSSPSLVFELPYSNPSNREQLRANLVFLQERLLMLLRELLNLLQMRLR